ncbi:Cna B-type domain-containing protein [Mediterraneibacter sp. NSJ-151]|uniref:Cna B-type domain-containing protein n=1 Tax=Mediterraneibacter sp. NSJ-151 TaxID=2897708 RepID=UPI001F0A98EC|nr:Cna B-type domain-containing protein [Mediterraneibacter sp. NSJ-151]MCH4279533.1 Cna B-type domain-containing protein [Mediterraneibacter sp. NSJ-151]
MKKKRRIENRIIAVILCMAILFSQVNIADAADLNPSGTNTSQVALSDETNMSNDEASTESSVSDEINGTTESESSISEETNENSKNNESESSGGNVKAESTDNIDAYYKDSKICIYNYEQLKQIGSDAYVYTGDKDGKIGSGDVVKSEGTELKYGADAQYILMNDIQMNLEQMWSVPDSFTGTITGTEVEENETPTLYDKETDTIYIYNPYQLMVLAQEESETEPVMTLDYDAPQFGMGQMIYPNGEDKDYLTYSKDHNYVISKNFSSDKPELVADQLSIDPDTTDTEGRDFKGQVVKTIGDKTYILIGNEEQLRAIGSGKTVYGAVYQAVYKGVSWKIDKDGKGNSIMLYGGDADLKQEQNGKQDFTFGTILEKDSKLSAEGIHTRGRCGVNQNTGKIDPDLDIDKMTGQTYSANANYIIFRDIDLGSSNWTPLTFQGTMIGAKSAEKGGLWKDGVINTIDKPVISNVTVNQSTKINVGEQMGVGFFSTISSEVSEKDIGLSKGLVKVSNIQFNNLKVHTTTNETYYPDTLVSALTKTLGQLLGGLLSGLTFILTFGQVKIDLGKTLGDVLDARKKDPTALSTGAIAGRVEGQVEISNIEVNNANVKNVNGYTGGFVGYAVGSTQYDGLSNALGNLVKLLTNILNVIPGLGLGDLIKILLGNAIPLGKLIPTGYINPKIVNCNVNGLTISTASDKEYAGGFIGMQKGAIVENSSVTGGTNTISGKNFVGGFVGLARDDVIEGTLSGALDIETKLPKMNTESLLLNCSLNNAVVSVSGESYIGGFAGGLANASTVNCNVKSDNALTVTASGNYAGGFAGIASLGWAADLGKDDTKDNLLGGVVDLVVKLLSSNPGATSSLLSLAGVNPSHILGCSVNASLQVSGKDYVGGITGRGNGAYIAQSNADNLQKISYWKNNVYDVGSVQEIDISLTGLSSVTGNDYVGGIAGSMGTASVAGLLNTTLGVASYLAFTVDNVHVNGAGNGFTVTGNERVGGGFGDAIGGSITTVSINDLASTEGNNLVGGFIGLSGPGDLAGADGGLTVNLLGLNYLLKLNNLLSLGQAIEVKINKVNVNGVTNGFTVHAKGSRDSNSVRDYSASGFIAKSGSTKVEDSHVTNLKSVKAADNGGYASGFVAISKTGGLADVADDNSIKSLIETNGLVNAVGYLIPKYTNCTVSFVNGGSVTADVAGGFAADFQSGTVDNSLRGENDYYAVYNLDSVNGQSYAGGFGGNVYSGALADAGKGISVLGNINGLNINIGELLNLVNAYVPIIKYAGVKSDNGFTVSANKFKSDDTNSGSAGGFIGYGSGVQVSHCDVTNLKHTKVTPPKDLEGEDSSNYFGQESTYAVTGARYAGGYIGYMNIGSAASVGKGLKVLDTAIGLNDVLDALNVVVSTIEHSDVTGGPGGFAVRASMKNTASDASDNDVLGDAGGFVGKISGGHIQNSNSYNFSYIIGQITAGGYVGDLQPGSVADALGETSILGGLVNTKETLASLAEDFVPTIRNSSTTCIPCGGAVRADAISTTTTQRGMAGGYAGHNEGGHIWGNNTNKWKGQDYTGPKSTCKAVRIRSVYGKEIAGGFTGLMESADTAKAGSLSLLWGLVKVDNILGALSVVYPTEENTEVYGPLALMDLNTWNSWVEYVGKYGGYGSDFSNLVQSGKINTQEDLDKILGQYVYGYNVVAGRTNYRDETILSNGGAAGGYVGSMLTGTITNGQAHDTKLVKGLRCAGGFAGEMINGGAANLGGTSILGLNLQLGQMLEVLNVFVPVIKQSSVEGYQSGLMVQSNGNNDKDLLGYAGGYVGKLIGGQIWGDDTLRCKVTKLRRVDGKSYVGGFVGSSKPGSVATVDPVRGEGLFLTKLLEKLLDTPTDLINVLNATVATIRYADVEAWNDWGVIVNGAYDGGGKNTSYAKAVGGFAGMLEGTVLGKKDEALAGVTAQNIRSVVSGEYAGGCFGIADVAGVANISAGSETSLLDKLLKLGRVDVLDAFRSYVYYGNVSGSKDAGLSVSANIAKKYGQNNEVTYSGTAGGFGGSLLNGSVKNSKVTNLSNVRGLNSVGGFVGYSGKSGVVKADKIDVLGNNTGQLLGGALGVMDIFGSHIDDCTVTGTDDGYTVQSTNGDEQIAGGFIGYANLARMSNCTAGDKTNQKIGLKQVASGGTAGGFAGRTSFAYLADLKLDSGAVNVIVSLVNKLIKALYLDKIQDSNLLNINLGIIKVDALYAGKLLHVNLLGLDISVGLSKKSTDNKQQTDLAIITIGDSSIKLPCDENGLLDDNDAKSNISVSLIKANRTRITDSNVYGVSHGYDVYAGGAGNDKDGSAEDGRSGGFVGFNDEGLLKNNNMYYCDVVRGTKDLVGPFSGKSELNTVYDFNSQEKVEGEKNNYRIYRKLDQSLDEIKKNNSILNSSHEKDEASGWDIYTIGHMDKVKIFETLKNAVLTSKSDSVKADLNAYESPAKAVLMSDTKTTLNTGDSDTPEPSESQDPCDEYIKLTINKVWKDLNNLDKKRPVNIKVTISRAWTDAAGKEQTETVSGYENYIISGSSDKSTWQEVINGLPAYTTDENKIIHYYTYSVTETEIKGYTTTIETSKDGFTFTIINRHFALLPDTGGEGIMMFIIAGGLLLAFLLYTGRRRKRKQTM